MEHHDITKVKWDPYDGQMIRPDPQVFNETGFVSPLGFNGVLPVRPMADFPVKIFSLFDPTKMTNVSTDYQIAMQELVIQAVYSVSSKKYINFYQHTVSTQNIVSGQN